MMKKAYILLMVGLVYGSVLRAQVALEMGEPYYITTTSTLGEVIGQDETGYYFLLINKSLPKQLIIEHFDKNLKRILSKKIHFIPDGKDRKYEFVFYSNNNIYFFSSYVKASPHNKRVVDVQTINKETLELNNDLREVARVDNFYSGMGRFEFALSKDRRKLVIFCDHPYIANEQEKFGFKVLDANLQELWSKDIVFPTDQVTGFLSYSVTDQGKLMLTTIRFDQPDKETSGKPKRVLVGGELRTKISRDRKKTIPYEYVLVKHHDNILLPLEYKVSLGNKFINDLKYETNEEGNLVCAGFYSEGEATNDKGFYYCLFDGITGVLKKNTITEFSRDFIVSGLNKYQAKDIQSNWEKGKDIDRLQYQSCELIIKENNDAVLIGELPQAEEVSTRNYYAINYYGKDFNIMHYCFGGPNLGVGLYGAAFYGGAVDTDMVIFCMNNGGDLKWSEKIVKKQVIQKQGDAFASHGVAVTKDKIYLFYNDDPRNLNSSPDNELHNLVPGNGGVTVVAEIGDTGIEKKTALVSFKEAQVIMEPRI